MSLVSEAYWHKCPQHFTWMPPTLRPREWRCNVPTVGGPPGIDGRTCACSRTERYRWWRSLDRKVFSILEVNGQMQHYYCPACEHFFGSRETGYSPPYFRLCSTFLRMGTEHNLRYASCATCDGAVEFFATGPSLFQVEVLAVYCRNCGKFLCSRCVPQHLCGVKDAPDERTTGYAK